MDTEIKLNIKKKGESIITAIGVGGGGCNAINHMHANHIEDVEYIVCNTDKQALDGSSVKKKLQIGINLTEGLGAGADPTLGKNAALESKDDIRTMLENTKMLFITAGMGGGTGTGAAPIIANIAKEMDILVIGIVTAPFKWEGLQKIKKAKEGIEELKKYCDSTIVIQNDKVVENHPNTELDQAFKCVDEVLLISAKGIAEMITKTSTIMNLDFRDVYTTMNNSKTTLIGSAITEGEERATVAVEKATESPLTNIHNVKGAKKAIVSIVAGNSSEFKMNEMDTINKYIEDKTGGAELIIGYRTDEELEDKIEVTVIITGFEHSEDTFEESNLRKAPIIEEDVNIQEKELKDDSLVDVDELKNSHIQNEITKNKNNKENRTTKITQEIGQKDLFIGLEDINNVEDNFPPMNETTGKNPPSNVAFNEKLAKLKKDSKLRIIGLKNESYEPPKNKLSNQVNDWKYPQHKLSNQEITKDGEIKKFDNYLHNKAD